MTQMLIIQLEMIILKTTNVMDKDEVAQIREVANGFKNLATGTETTIIAAEVIMIGMRKEKIGETEVTLVMDLTNSRMKPMKIDKAAIRDAEEIVLVKNVTLDKMTDMTTIPTK